MKHKLLKSLPPLAIIVLSLGIYQWMLTHQKEPETRPPSTARTAVDVVPIPRTNFRVHIPTRGTVSPRTSSTLIPEISGRIVSVSPSFREGEFFEENDVLVTIDDIDYKTAVTVSQGALAESQAALEQEKARAEQALDNWKALGRGGDPSPLVLRQPQLAEAQARVDAAAAQVAKAERDLARTSIQAPYTGRVLEQMVDVGQYVTPGTVLAGIYAVDYAEIRLPISSAQAAFVDLPETYHQPKSGDAAPVPQPNVTVSTSYGGQTYKWNGRVVRTEGAIDSASRLIFVVAQVDDPYGEREKGMPPLKLGMFVEAEIEGELLKDVIIIPRKAVRQGNSILTVDAENKLRRHEIEIVWTDATNVVSSTHIPEGERLCTTALAFAPDGTPVDPHEATIPAPVDSARKSVISDAKS
jgi:multidrug efflux system membrane fusion protein